MRCAAAAFACSLLAASALAQTIDRTHPPTPDPPRPYKLPPVFETHLPNGLTILLIDDARVPLATVRLAFPCGNRRDPKDLPGLSGAVADMLTQGTNTRGFIQIAEALDGLGGAMNASSGADYIALNGSIDSQNLPSMIGIMADVARNASFPEVDLRLYKQNRKQTLARQRGQPAFVANEEFREALFGDHPYAHVGPTAAAIDGLGHKALTDFRDTWMVPNNGFFIAVGRLPARADMMKLLTNSFAAWERKALPELKPASLPAASGAKPRLILIDRPGAPQVDVHMGRIAATQRDPAYFAEIAASLIVGGVPMGRMFLDLREKRGFAYDVRTEHVAFDEAGVLSEVTQVRNEVAADAIQAMLDHLNRMAAEPVSEKELADAKSQADGSFVLRLETQASLADELTVDRIQNLPPDYLQTWRARVEAVTAAEVQSAAKKYLSTQDSVVVVVGDAAKIRESLARVGEFEIVKPVP